MPAVVLLHGKRVGLPLETLNCAAKSAVTAVSNCAVVEIQACYVAYGFDVAEVFVCSTETLEDGNHVFSAHEGEAVLEVCLAEGHDCGYG